VSGLRFGVLGNAKIARAQVVPAMLQAGQTVVAVGSRSSDRAEWAQALGARWCSYEAVLQDPQVEAVYIALPHHLHAQWSALALQAGKHVLCEKPMALSRAEKAQAASGCVFAEAYMVRHHPQWAWLRQLDFGPIRHIHVSFAYDNRDPANIRNQAHMGGGALWDIGCYAVFAGHWLLGSPDRVALQRTLHPQWGTDIHSHGQLFWGQGPDAARLDFFVSTQSAKQQQLTVVGQGGWARLESPFNPPEVATVHWSPSGLAHEAQTLQLPPCNAYAVMVADFVRTVAGEPPPLGGAWADSDAIQACLSELLASDPLATH
jgi:predicted dehydrogenase